MAPEKSSAGKDYGRTRVCARTIRRGGGELAQGSIQTSMMLPSRSLEAEKKSSPLNHVEPVPPGFPERRTPLCTLRVSSRRGSGDVRRLRLFGQQEWQPGLALSH